ncbi:MAG: DNA/RNA non-specific endonuclease [Flammeovirgaceae bacterium]|nr:MAG: DNA/RNA non-specific endonuclease [Flammeovirgaceae bacterium]
MSMCSSVKRMDVDNHLGLEIPLLQPDEQLIEHTGFKLVYNENHEQANWVAYELTLEETRRGVERSDKFLPDQKVSTGTATPEDYKGSGYDRGHLAPAADMSWSAQAMKESFYFSNISPQVPAFNRGIWKRLEEQVRTWAQQDTAAFIVTGPVLSDSLPVIGPNQVSVPAYFYKALLVYRYQNQKAIAFIVPNKKSGLPLKHFAVTVDSLEHITGIDFFPALPDVIESKLESELCLPCWRIKEE